MVARLATVLACAILGGCAGGAGLGGSAPASAPPARAIDAPSPTLEGRPPRAAWIWAPGEPKPKNAYVYFRRSFELPAKPARARAYVSASPVADLFINGRLVERVPVNADPEFQTYDRFDITEFLRAGPNVVAGLVHVYGVGMHHRMDVRGGLFFQAEIDLANGRSAAIDSGADWRARPADAWSAETPLRHEGAHLIGFKEAYDARREPLGWNAPGFAEGEGWSPAAVVGVPPVPPWTRIVVVRRPFLARERLSARSTWEKGNLLIADFGREVVGHPRVKMIAAGGLTLEIGTAERLKSDETPNTTATLDYRDSYITREGAQEWQPFTWRGFRYVTVRAPDEVKIEDVAVETRAFAVDESGAFESSDALLNQVWRVGRYTTALCMQDTLIDTPWREQTQYIAGDSRYLQRYGAYAFGPSTEVLYHYNLLSGAASQRWSGDGAIRGRYPTEYLLGPKTSTYIPDYQLEWVLMLSEHYLYFGRAEVVRELMPALERLLKGFAARVSAETGLLGASPGWTVLDHPDTSPMDVDGENTGMNALYHGALRAAAWLSRAVLGDEERARRLDAAAASIRAAVNQHLWSEAAGAYRDGRTSDRVTPQTQVYLLVYGLVPPERRERLLGLVEKEGRKAEQSFSHWVLSAMFEAGRAGWALDYIRTHWGGQMRQGSFNGAWPEAWDSASGSTSHGWSSGPTSLLPEKVVGLAPLLPGWRRFEVRPRPGDLTWAKARVETVRGVVGAAWKRATGGGFGLELRVPDGTEADLTPPAVRPTDSVEIDGQLAWPRASRSPAAAEIVDERPTFRVGSGVHKLAVGGKR